MEASLKSSCVSVLSFLHSFVYLWCWICHNVQNVKLYNGPFLPIYEIRWGTRPPLTLKKVYMITIYRDFFKIISRIYRDTPSNKWSFGSQLTTHKYITVLRFVFTFREAKDRKLAHPLIHSGQPISPTGLLLTNIQQKFRFQRKYFLKQTLFLPSCTWEIVWYPSMDPSTCKVSFLIWFSLFIYIYFFFCWTLWFWSWEKSTICRVSVAQCSSSSQFPLYAISVAQCALDISVTHKILSKSFKFTNSPSHELPSSTNIYSCFGFAFIVQIWKYTHILCFFLKKRETEHKFSSCTETEGSILGIDNWQFLTLKITHRVLCQE
jgi:hypothetical protein